MWVHVRCVSLPRLIVLCGFAKSNGEARRLTEQGAVSIDGEVITDVQAEIAAYTGMVLKVGKRRYMRIILD